MDKEKQQKFDLRYLEMARIWAKNSYCQRRQVGALVVKDGMIISDGYNGTPSGFENVCALYRVCQTDYPVGHQAGGIW